MAGTTPGSISCVSRVQGLSSGALAPWKTNPPRSICAAGTPSNRGRSGRYRFRHDTSSPGTALKETTVADFISGSISAVNPISARPAAVFKSWCSAMSDSATSA